MVIQTIQNHINGVVNVESVVQLRQNTISENVRHLISLVSSAVLSFFSTCYTYVKRPIARSAFPSSTVPKEACRAIHESLLREFQNLELTTNEYGHAVLTGKEKSIPIPNTTTTLSGFTFKNNAKESGKNRHVIFFDGNHRVAEQAFVACQDLAEGLKADVTCYNYPGVGLSTGETLGDSDLLAYGRAVIDSVRAEDPTIHELVLYGYSLGGSVATILAKEYEQRGVTLVLVNDRSFTNISTLINSTMPMIIRSIVATLSSFCGWKLDASAAAQNLRSKTLVITASNDKNIPAHGQTQFINSYSQLPANVTSHIHQGEHLTPLSKEVDIRALSDFLSI